AIDVGRLGDDVQRNEAAVTPAPDADPRRVNVREPANRASGGRLIVRLDDAHLLVNDLAPRAAARAGPAVIDARDDVAALRQHLIPQIVRTAPTIRHGLRARAAINGKEYGIACRRIEIRRADEPGVELDAIADVDFPELHRAQLEAGDFRLQAGVVDQRAQRPIVRETHERYGRRHAEP